MKLNGKVALITGSSRGIGREIALLFARRGAKVVVTYNNSKAEAQKVADECSEKTDCILVKLDVRNEKSIQDAVDATIKEFKKIDILVNNAGVLSMKSFHSQSFKEIDEQIQTNLVGAMKMTSVVLPHLEETKDAFIINVASMAGKQAFDELVPYYASKFGLRGFTQALAHELPDFIKVYSVNPGLTATEMTNFKGIEPRLVADVIAQVVEGKINKDSGEDVDVEDYYEGNKKKLGGDKLEEEEEYSEESEEDAEAEENGGEDEEGSKNPPSGSDKEITYV